MKKRFCLLIVLMLCWCGCVQAENWTRNTVDIKERGWSNGDGYIIFADLVNPPVDNLNHCGENEEKPDKALKFNVQALYNAVNNSSFDVNNIYVDGLSTGESALNIVQLDNLRHRNGWQFRYLWNNNQYVRDWSQYNGYVYVCVGWTAQQLTSDTALENIILWYDNSKNITKQSEIPKGVWNFSGNLAWYPSATSCQNADIWRRYDNQQIVANANTQSVDGYNVCSANNVLPECVESSPSSCGSQGISTVHFSTGVDTTITPQPDQGYIDPVSNHKHAVGMHYVKYKMPGQKNWHKGEVTVDQGTNQKLNIRVKIKEKEGWVQNNVYVDLYYSGNKWFSRSHDTKVSTKKIKKLKKKQKESVYFYNINLSNLPIGHHYYFADIRYGDKHNISSRKDDTEYVVVNVQDPNNLPTGYVDRVTCDTITGWASDEDSSSPLNVHIYDGNAMIANIYADDYRSDVGYRSFTYTIPESYKDGTLHRFRVFAINEPQGKNPLLTQGSFTFACGNTGAMPVTRFYNSHKVAHFYSIRPEDEQGITRKFRDWEAEGTTFNAFPNPQDGTIPLYTCWTGSTHDYDTDPAYVGDQKPCTESVWKLFDVYQDDGPNRTPIYLMYRANKDNYIFAVGQDDVQHLQSTYGFSKVYTDPLFYTPNSLVSEEITTINPPDDTVTPISLDKSTDETEQKNFNQASFLLID